MEKLALLALSKTLIASMFLALQMQFCTLEYICNFDKEFTANEDMALLYVMLQLLRNTSLGNISLLKCFFIFP